MNFHASAAAVGDLPRAVTGGGRSLSQAVEAADWLKTDLLDQALVLQCWTCGRGAKVAATVVQRGMMLTQEGCKDKLLHTAGSWANM